MCIIVHVVSSDFTFENLKKIQVARISIKACIFVFFFPNNNLSLNEQRKAHEQDTKEEVLKRKQVQIW